MSLLSDLVAIALGAKIPLSGYHVFVRFFQIYYYSMNCLRRQQPIERGTAPCQNQSLSFPSWKKAGKIRLFLQSQTKDQMLKKEKKEKVTELAWFTEMNILVTL